MSFTPREYLRHILTEVEFLLAHAGSVAREEFIADDVLRRAAVRSIEIIGEASKQIPAQFRDEHSEIAWRVMARMRDRLIHAYFGIDYDIVWRVAKEDAPLLKQQIEEILAAEPPPEQPKS
jgi:uncharacterized protein with HEPN domain